MKPLIFPDSLRLARFDELPGTESERSAAWKRVQSAQIRAGYTLAATNDARFSRYAEINVDAPQIWQVFCELCRISLGPISTLVASWIDDDPIAIGSGDTASIIAILEQHKYQLANDGFLQFGLLSDESNIEEIFVTPTKHFKVWLNDETAFRSVMDKYDLPEQSKLSFIDEYPRTTVALTDGLLVIRDQAKLLRQIGLLIGALEAPTTN